MFRVHAVTDTAQVVELQTFGDFSDQHLVCDPVGALGFPIHGEDAVPAIGGGSPAPASFVIRLDFRPEVRRQSGVSKVHGSHTTHV